MRVSFAVAPYFRSKLTTANKEDVIKATKEIQQKAQKLATELGLTITGVKPLGGTYLGSSEISWFYEIKGGTREGVDLFASLMGDLSNEYQDAVIASNYVSEESADANAIEVTLIKENAKIEDIEKHLNELGIEGSSYHFDSGELIFFVDRYKYIGEEKIEKTDEEIDNEINNIFKLTEENYGYKFREQNFQNSRYLGNENRQEAYRSWMSNGPQNRKLYKACEKALAICEATAPYYAKAYDDNATDEEKRQEEAERLKAAVDAANRWDEEHLKKKEASPTPVVSTAENIVTLNQEEPSSTELSNTSDTTIEDSSNNTFEEPFKTSLDERTKKKLENYEKYNIQLNNLLDSKLISATEVRHVAQQIVDYISDIITDILTNPEKLSEEFPIVPNVDITSFSREQLIAHIGINNLISKAKEKFIKQNRGELPLDDYGNPIDREISTIRQTKLILDNWDALISIAADRFAFNEGVGLKRNHDTNNYENTEQTSIDVDNFDNDTEYQGVSESSSKDEQEASQLKANTIDVLNHMASLVKQELHRCYILDTNHKRVFSKWGIPERINPENAVNQILNWVSGSTNLQEMISRISNKANTHPWVIQLLEKLEDTSGEYTDFQSQFYSNFSRDFQLYSIVLDDNKRIYSTKLNEYLSTKTILKKIDNLIKIGQHPLFQNGIVNRKLLGKIDDVRNTDEFTLHKALTELTILKDTINNLKEDEEFSQEDLEKAINNIVGIYRIFGITNIDTDTLIPVIDKNTIKTITSNLKILVDLLDKVKFNQLTRKLQNYNPFEYDNPLSIRYALSKILHPVSSLLDETTPSAFYEDGKIRQSYIIPSWLTMRLREFKKSREEFIKFIENEYKASEWYYDKKASRENRDPWRTPWLSLMMKDDNLRNIFSHKVELTFNQHSYMRNMTDTEYTLSLITEYLSESNINGRNVGWYRIPMQSNKPSNDFIRFIAYKEGNYKDDIVEELSKMVFQEISRIQTVIKRNKKPGDPGFIKNFDTNGKKFCFFPVFNAYLEGDNNEMKILTGDNFKDNKTLSELLKQKIEGELTDDIKLEELIKAVLKTSIQQGANSILKKWKDTGIIEAAKNIKDLQNKNIEEELENFIWNDTFASKNILQLTVGDIAFFKDTEELQKRLAQLHSPGIRGNVNALAYKGSKYSINGKVSADGLYRTVVLKDFDSFIANIIANITEVFDRKIRLEEQKQERRDPSQRDYKELIALKALKEDLVRPPKTLGEKDKGGKYWNINVTDAQAYSSLTSYRKKAYMFGKWSTNSEALYEKLLKGEANITDLETSFQILKPFLYANKIKDLGNPDLAITHMPVPFQAKNAEYLLVMAENLLKDEKLSRPNLLKAISDIMEDSAFDGRERDEKGNIVKEGTYNGRGIDTIQFESAIKVGLQVSIDLTPYLEMPNGERAAYEYMKSMIYREGTHNYDTTNIVQEIPFDNYCLQQEVPKHFLDHAQGHGSQIRMITPADLDFYTTDAQGNTVENIYEYNGFKATAKEFRAIYEKTIADKIQESLDKLVKELHLDSANIIERNLALSEILQREIASSPRYGIDLAQACQINTKTGEFRIPLGDPVQGKRIEQLINSIIKNRVNNQKIAGGPIAQVSNYGFSTLLHIRFKDNKGELLPLEKDYNPEQHNGKSYKDFIKENQNGIAAFECLLPAFTKDLFKCFMNPDGTIDIEAVKATNPELLKMISYRIPSEDKYSCAPMMAVGFLPKEAGEAIMLPYELTEIDDSDFDVDKRYVMRKELFLRLDHKKVYDKVRRIMYDLYVEETGKPLTGIVQFHINETINNTLSKLRNEFEDNTFTKEEEKVNSIIEQLKKTDHYIWRTKEPDSNTPVGRNNKIIDMTMAVMTNKETADKILNPGGFDNIKKIAYLITAYKTGKYSWDELENMSIDELKDLSYTEKDLTFVDTQIQFYNQNAAASLLIGIFAVQKIAHAILQDDNIYIKIEKPFEILDTKFGEMQIDPVRDTDGNLIGKTLGSTIASAADAVKAPVLNLLNINISTVNAFVTMLRLGMPLNDAALFLSQPIIEKLINNFNKKSLTKYCSIDSIIDEALNDYKKRYHITNGSDLDTEGITKKELMQTLVPPISDLQEGSIEKIERDKIKYKILLAFKKLNEVSKLMEKPTFATRFNSIANAVGPLIIDNLITKHKLDSFNLQTSNGTETGFYKIDESNGERYSIDINDILNFHPILKNFAIPFQDNSSYSGNITSAYIASIFEQFPSGSKGFQEVLAAIPPVLQERIYGDRQLLNQLSGFYQSALAVYSGLIDENTRSYYLEKFPTEFLNIAKEQKYADNKLVQAIELVIKKGTNTPHINIPITGRDESYKEELRSAWVDLHKIDPKLSQDLFNYCFFRGGIGFSPKTFMALLPTYVKEHLVNNGISYIDTYSKFPSVNPEAIIDQFIRNNYTNSKLVPTKNVENIFNKIRQNGSNQILVLQSDEDAAVERLPYIKIKSHGSFSLWKLVEINEQNKTVTYEAVSPLGNNEECLEIYKKALSNTTSLNTVSDIRHIKDASEITTVSNVETGSTDITVKPESTIEIAKKIDKMVSMLMDYTGRTEESATELNAQIKENPKKYIKFLQKMFESKDIIVSKEKVMDEYNKYC